MAGNGGEEDFLDLWSDIDFPSLEQLLLAEDFPMAEPSNGGDDRRGVSGAQSNNAQAPYQQSAQTAVATPHAQGNSNGTLDSLTVLNLESQKTLYMLKQTEAIPSEGQVDRRTCETLGYKRFKATSEPFSVLRIGNYEVRPRYPAHLIAKWYYTKKRLNWEILENGLKKKIEISWQDISAIRVEYRGNVELLEIELSKPPHFYRETEVRPKKHTSWKPSYDFTDCQACTYRRHHLEFPQGTLEKNMEPLFFLDPGLRELSRRPFPSSESPFFVGHITEAPQSAPRLFNSELIELHHHLHHQLPPNHSSVPACLADDEPKILIPEYQRRWANHQMPSLENSLSSQVSDYGYAPPPSLPRNGTIFNGHLFMGHSPGEQIVAPLSYKSGTSHGQQGYDHNSNHTNMTMASNSSAEMNVAHHTNTWNNQGIFNQDMGHHSGLASSSNAPAMDVPSSSCYCTVTNYYAGQGSHEEYNSNNEPCMNDTNPHHAPVHAHVHGMIYPKLESNHDHHHQDHQFMVDYNTANFWGDKPTPIHALEENEPYN